MVVKNVHFKVPTLVVNLDKCTKNIEKIWDKAIKAQVELRPHFKTHQSAQIAELYRKAGVDKINVSSLRMAEYFSQYNWADILVAFPVNVLEYELINKLNLEITLRVLVNSIDSLESMTLLLDNPLRVKIEIDCGGGRSGINHGDVHTIDTLYEAIQTSERFLFDGFYSHAGHTYQARGEQEIRNLFRSSITNLKKIHQRFPQASFSFGDTPSASVADEFGFINEITPGNFVYYDLSQVQIGSCNRHEIAVHMVCPLVEFLENKDHFIIYGGAVHFSKDKLEVDGKSHFGEVYQVDQDGNLLLDKYIGMLTSVSQEHGIVSKEKDLALKPGDLVGVLPVHSCLTADLQTDYLGSDGTWIRNGAYGIKSIKNY